MSRTTKRILLLLGLTLVGSATSWAQTIVTYGNLGTFNTTIGAAPVTVEDFGTSFHFPISTGVLNSLTNLVVSSGSPITPGQIKPGVTYSTAIGTSTFFNIDTGAGFTGGFLDSVTGVGALTITFNGTVNAFGFDASTFSGSSFNVTINFSSGSPYTGTFSPANPAPQFFGFTSNASNVTSIVILGSDLVRTFGIDNFRFVNSNVTSVPEPGTAWLLGGGLAVLAVWRRRRK